MIGDPQKVGNKYVYQNMSDEERRIFDEEKRNRIKAEKGLENMKGKELDKEKRRLEEESKKKVAEIISVKFTDNNGKPKNSFKTGEDIIIKINFKISDAVKDFNFGFGLYNIYNNYIFGINTIVDKIDTKKYLKQGYYQIKLKNNVLLSNSYYIMSSIVRDNFLDANIYDYIQRSETFRIFSISKNEGVFGMEYEWC